MINIYKVAIIDDEILIANGLKDKINWADLDCEVCGVATDGINGKKVIDLFKPDLVITDIVMPGMTGLDIAQFVFFNCPDTVVIFLTAHKEFDYAQQAIQYGVNDYILKPINVKLLIQTIKKAIAKLKNKQSTEKYQNDLEDIVNKTKPVLSNMILFDIAVNGNMGNDRYDSDLYLSVNKGCVAVIQTAQGKSQCLNKLHQFALKSAIEDVLEEHKYDYAIKEKDRGYIVLFKFDTVVSDSIIKNRAINVCSSICDKVQIQFQYHLTIGIGSCWKKVNEIHNSYTQALNAISSGFFTDRPSVIHIDDIKSDSNIGYSYYQHYNLYACIVEGKEEKALHILNEILRSMEAIGEERKVKQLCKNIIDVFNELTHSHCKNKDQTFSAENVDNFFRFYDLKKYLIECLSISCNSMKKYADGLCCKYIEKALRIIQEKYMDPDLGLEKISEELEVNYYYLSRLFKKELNTSFIKYLTKVRIEKAKELLVSSKLKNTEIAEKVGFRDARYFSQVLKKEYGMTPTELRQNA